MAYVREGLRDFSISRAAVDWGIRVPQDPQHTVYVWFDALIGAPPPHTSELALSELLRDQRIHMVALACRTATGSHAQGAYLGVCGMTDAVAWRTCHGGRPCWRGRPGRRP